MADHYVFVGLVHFVLPSWSPSSIDFHESLYYGLKLEHSLINPNQVRSYNILVDDEADGDEVPDAEPEREAGIGHRVCARGTYKTFHQDKLL